LFWCKFSHCYFLVDACVGKTTHCSRFGTPTWLLKIGCHINIFNSVACLTCSSIARRNGCPNSGWRAPQDRDNHRRWCISC
jgi:hypothetical protein